ncbi:inositol oxygenase [Choanephora cucurbitarum]|nr:inositol oxygenase [Choanephora cucurbitarum]
MRVIPSTQLAEAARISDAWDHFLQQKYGGKNSSTKETSAFRDYTVAAVEQPTVAAFYKENHEKQTVEHVLSKKKLYGGLTHNEMGIWDMLELMDTMVDESDPDTSFSQIVHSLQSAEAARRDGQPRWMILTALIHDLGKYLFFLGEPQWSVVGDTFPVGCQYSDKIVHAEYLKGNPDYEHPVYSTRYGIYSPHCGLDNVHLSYGHDEYMYQVCKDYLPIEALYILRYHSFYACHKEGQYGWLLNDQDVEMMKWVKVFNQYDLYSKAEAEPNIEELKPYYMELINEYFPEKIKW